MSTAFELTKYITIGQYLPTNSIIHRIDAKYKIFAFVLAMIAITFCTTYLQNIIALLLCTLLFYLAKIPLKYGLSGIKPAIPFLIILAILQLLFSSEMTEANGAVYFEYGWIKITSETVKLVVISLMRFVEVIFLLSVLTLSTSITNLVRGMEKLLHPLEKIKFPVHAFSLVMTIAIRFVPTFAMEMERMMKAQASRGAEFGTRKKWRMMARIKDTLLLIIPLFNIALRRAEDLILAMESRCYMPENKRYFWRGITVRKIVIAGVLSSITILLGVTRLGFVPIPTAAGAVTIMHIPVIIGAIMEGWGVGLVIGFIFGLSSFLNATIPIFKDPLVSILPRLFIGIAAYLTYAGLKKTNQYFAIGVASFVGSLTNTILVLTMAVLRGYLSPGVATTVALINGLPEAIVSIMMVLAVLGVWQKSKTMYRQHKSKISGVI